MSDILSQLWTPELQMAVTVCIVMLVAVYVLSIIWVVRDAYQRGTVWYIWAIVALVPILGVIAYCLLRPPLLQIDRDEQELEVALKQRQLMQYGECANCGYPVEADYVLCPNCHQRLKNQCQKCGHALDPRGPFVRTAQRRFPASALVAAVELPARRGRLCPRRMSGLMARHRASKRRSGLQSCLKKSRLRAAFLVVAT